MLQRLRLVPNLLSSLRLILVPVLWALALLNLKVYLGVTLAIAFTTDGLDGFIARKFNLSTKFGSRLDSAADTLLQISTWIWLLLLEPEAVIDHPWLFWGASLISLISMMLGLIKFSKLPDLHLYSTKIAGFAYSLFMVTTFLFEGYIEILFFTMILFVFVGAIETTLLQIISRKTNEKMGSLLFVLLKRTSVPKKAT